MHEKQLLPWETQLGDIGETEIKSRLQRLFSTVTKIERDVGIDFYCELIINDIPAIPFYVQAKSSQHFDSKHGRSIKRNIICYWLSKPNPVYVIFYDEPNDMCYWKSIEEDRYQLTEKIFKDDSKSTYVQFSTLNILERSNNNQEFRKKLEEDYNSLSLFRGNPQFIGRSYVKKVPETPRTTDEYIRIKENARASLYSLIFHHIQTKEFNEAIKYSEVVAVFDNSHYNHFAWLGYLYKKKKEIEKARLNFKKAIDICKRDDKWEKKSINEIIKRLESEINDLSEK